MTGCSSRVALVVLAALALGARPAAWSCALPQPVEQEFAESTAVFVGRVIATEVRTGRESEASTVATFAVERAWKGVSASTVEVATCGGGNEICTVAVEFRVGERYLVFAGGEPLFTSKCGRTGTAKHDLWEQTWEWLSQRPRRLLG